MWAKNYPFKRFVKATTAETSFCDGSSVKKEADSDSEQHVQHKGEQLRAFYEELTRDENRISNESIKVEVKKEEIIVGDDDDDEVAVVGDTTAEKKFLTAIQQGEDIEHIRQKFEANIRLLLECRDRYGWSPLMVAAAAGREDVVELLLTAGANTDVRDPCSTQTALELARAKGHFHVVELLNQLQRGMSRSTEAGQQKCYTGVGFEACDACGEIFVADQRVQHVGSVAHQLAAERKLQPVRPGFSLTEGNRGYQLLVRSGWDEQSGLGPHEERRGRLFPVKTVLKSDRTGLGGQGEYQKEAKVTHFGPGDKRSIEYRTHETSDGGRSSGYCNICQKKSEAQRCGCRERAIRSELWDL